MLVATRHATNFQMRRTFLSRALFFAKIYRNNATLTNIDKNADVRRRSWRFNRSTSSRKFPLTGRNLAFAQHCRTNRPSRKRPRANIHQRYLSFPCKHITRLSQDRRLARIRITSKLNCHDWTARWAPRRSYVAALLCVCRWRRCVP